MASTAPIDEEEDEVPSVPNKKQKIYNDCIDMLNECKVFLSQMFEVETLASNFPKIHECYTELFRVIFHVKMLKNSNATAIARSIFDANNTWGEAMHRWNMHKQELSRYLKKAPGVIINEDGIQLPFNSEYPEAISPSITMKRLADFSMIFLEYQAKTANIAHKIMHIGNRLPSSDMVKKYVHYYNMSCAVVQFYEEDETACLKRFDDMITSLRSMSQ